MIRNIVFDMGMVLLEYDPVKVCWEYTDNPEDVEWMRRELFDSKEWSLLDEGTLTDAQALERVQKRLPNEHLRWLAKESLEHWHEYNIWAKPGMGELVKELKEKGCGIYLCSNCSVRLRVFERGAGETLACGTGACAAVAAGIRLGLLDAQVDVQTRGGLLTIAWSGQEADSVFMTGPATSVFEGQIELPDTP